MKSKDKASLPCCQAMRREARIIHCRVGEYPLVEQTRLIVHDNTATLVFHRLAQARCYTQSIIRIAYHLFSRPVHPRAASRKEAYCDWQDRYENMGR
jgi:hypothetical protein